MKFTLPSVISLALAPLLGSTPAYASPVTYQATGTIYQTLDLNFMPTGFDTAANGQTLNIVFTLDPATPATSSSASESVYGQSILSASAQLGSATATIDTTDTRTIIDNNYLAGSTYLDVFSASSYLGPMPVNFTGSRLLFRVETYATSTSPLAFYNSTSLSNAPLTPSQWTGTLLQLTSFNYVNGVLQGEGIINASALEVSPVPLPAAVWFLLSGLGGFGALRRRRR
jgi:hypothetical protein